MNLNIPAALYRQITAHLSTAYPKEAAGLLLGTADGSSWHASRMLPLANKFAQAAESGSLSGLAANGRSRAAESWDRWSLSNEYKDSC